MRYRKRTAGGPAFSCWGGALCPRGAKRDAPKGPKAQRPKGPKGPKAQRPKGPKAQRPKGPKAQRPKGPKAQRPKGPKAQRPKGPKAQRPKGPKAQRPRGPKPQVPAGSQCLRPHGDARPPHEQGAGALRFGSDGAAVRADGGRPTSRGLPPAARWATLPCPAGQGALPVCGVDAVCPAGKSAAEWRAGSWRVTEGSEVSERFAHQGLSRRAGERTSPRKGRSFSHTPSPLRSPNEPLPQETEIRPISPSKHVLPPTKPSTFIHPWQTRPVTSRVSSPPHFAANIQRAPKLSFPRLFPPF